MAVQSGSLSAIHRLHEVEIEVWVWCL